MNPSREIIPLIQPHECDSEGGRVRGVLLYIVVTTSGSGSSGSSDSRGSSGSSGVAVAWQR